MRNNRQPVDSLWPWGITLLRVIVGLVFFMHGQQKLFDNGIDGVEMFFGSLGVPLPGLAAVVVTTVETLGGLALILGLLTRIVAPLLVADMLVAALVVHRENGFFVANNGYELVLLLAAGALALVVTGPGAAALDHALPLERRLRAGGYTLGEGRT